MSIEQKVVKKGALFKKKTVYSDDMMTAIIDSMAIVVEQLADKVGLDTPEVQEARRIMKNVQDGLTQIN